MRGDLKRWMTRAVEVLLTRPKASLMEHNALHCHTASQPNRWDNRRPTLLHLCACFTWIALFPKLLGLNRLLKCANAQFDLFWGVCLMMISVAEAHVTNILDRLIYKISFFIHLLIASCIVETFLSIQMFNKTEIELTFHIAFLTPREASEFLSHWTASRWWKKPRF